MLSELIAREPGEVVLVGNSLGATLALLQASAEPASIAGLVISKNPSLSAGVVKGIIEASAGGGVNFTGETGFGVVNAARPGRVNDSARNCRLVRS